MKVDQLKKVKDWGTFAQVGKSVPGPGPTPAPSVGKSLDEKSKGWGLIAPVMALAMTGARGSIGLGSQDTLPPARVPHPPSLFTRNFLEIGK